MILALPVIEAYLADMYVLMMTPVADG